MLCAKFQNDWVTYKLIMGKEDFMRFHFKMSLGRISYIAEHPRASAYFLLNYFYWDIAASSQEALTHYTLGDSYVILNYEFSKSMIYWAFPVKLPSYECYKRPHWWLVNTRCLTVLSHYLKQCWPSYMMSYNVTRQQWVKIALSSQTTYIDTWINYGGTKHLTDVKIFQSIKQQN